MLDEYFNKIKPYLRNVIIDLQNSDTWKGQLTIEVNFISSKVIDEERVMHSRGENTKFTFYNDVNKVVDEFFESLCSAYQENLETSMRWSDFIFDSLKLLYYKCHKINFKRGGSWIDSPDWIKNKNAKINPKNTDVFNMQYLLH